MPRRKKVQANRWRAEPGINVKTSGMTRLHRAVLANNVDEVRRLLDAGAALNVQVTLHPEYGNCTAVGLAAETGNAQILQLLAERKRFPADLTARNSRL